MPKPKAKKPATQNIVNRRARFDYELGEEIVAGLVLTGMEVRAAREGHVQLKGSFVSLRNGELWLNNASFSLRLNVRGEANSRSIDTSARKLLVSKKQLANFTEAKKQGMTIVPTKLLTNGKAAAFSAISLLGVQRLVRAYQIVIQGNHFLGHSNRVKLLCHRQSTF